MDEITTTIFPFRVQGVLNLVGLVSSSPGICITLVVSNIIFMYLISTSCSWSYLAFKSG